MKRDKQALVDIFTATQQALLYAQGIDQDSLKQDDEKQAAILYRLIVIGEAVKRLSNEFRAQYLIILLILNIRLNWIAQAVGQLLIYLITPAHNAIGTCQ